MTKRILSILLAVMMLFAFFTGCASSCKEKEPSKKKPTSSQTQSVDTNDDVSSGIAGDDEGDKSSHPYQWQIETTSTFFRDTEDAKVSAQTPSADIKHYKNPKNLGLVAYHCSLRWCDTYGTDDASRLREFTEIVEGKYFNQYFLGNNISDILIEAELIAKAGGSFWLGVGYDPKTETLKQYEEKLRTLLDAIEKAGYRDLVNGIHWDEPYWNCNDPKDLQDQMKVNYTVFGLRNFPVFGLAEFSDATPDVTQNGDPMPWVSPEYSKYITDAGYDYYSVDVRPGASNGNGGAYRQHSEYLGETVTTGQELYNGYTKRLKKLIGHNFNLWHFPCAYGTKTWDGVADEDFCVAAFEFFAKDVLDEDYAGGLAVYTYYTHTTTHGYIGLKERIPIKDEFGNYTHFPESEKWPNYFKLLQEYCQKFNSIKPKFVTVK